MTDASESRSPLHTLNPLGRFSSRSSDYARTRPSYPAAAIAAILDGLGDPSRLVAADMGAGTGISSRLLGDQGVQVWAIEPNPRMQATATPHPQVQYCTAQAEATELPSRSVNLVTCFQAFHWFRADEALNEFQRILQPGGRVALVWNDRDLTDPFTQAYNDVLRDCSEPDFLDRDDRKSPTRLVEHPGFTRYRLRHFQQQHPLTCEGLIGLAMSSSYVLQDAESVARLTKSITMLFQQPFSRQLADDGTMPLVYQTMVYMADVCT